MNVLAAAPEHVVIVFDIVHRQQLVDLQMQLLLVDTVQRRVEGTALGAYINVHGAVEAI